jgi:hypothetical protein
MTRSIVRGALWANDLQRLDWLDPNRDDYVLSETCADIPELAGAMEVSAAEVRRRLDRGSRAFVARSRDDAIAAWVWVSTGREKAPILHQELRFAADECYGWGARTLPAHRDRGLFTALLRHAGWRLGQEGMRWMWGGIEDCNVASRRANIAAGFRPILRLTARERLRVRPADYADEELVRRARRVLAEGGEG